MAKFILVYASLTGNTEMMAEAVKKGIEEAGEEVTMVDAMNGVFAKDLLDYDGILFGAYTWGDGDLPDDLLDLYDELDEVDLTGKKAAVFGSGDTGYDHFCGAVDLLVEKLTDRGADVFPEQMKVDLTPEEEEEEACKNLGKNFVAFVHAAHV